MPAVCITGMHRSGTSMVARLLNQAGVYFGDSSELLPAASDNEEGFWEHAAFVRLNDALLETRGAAWDHPGIPSPGWHLSPAVVPLRARAHELTSGLQSKADWGWKDPRASLTMPFWEQVIPDLRVVVCLRNPLEVAASLAKRGRSSQRFGVELWLQYNRALLRALRPGRYVVTHYDSYFTDPVAELRRVADAIGFTVSEQRLVDIQDAASSRLRHNRATTTDLLALPDEVKELYFEMTAEAGPVYQQALRHEVRDAPGAPALSSLESDYRGALVLLRLESQIREREAMLERELALAREQLQAEKQQCVAAKLHAEQQCVAAKLHAEQQREQWAAELLRLQQLLQDSEQHRQQASVELRLIKNGRGWRTLESLRRIRKALPA